MRRRVLSRLWRKRLTMRRRVLSRLWEKPIERGILRRVVNSCFGERIVADEARSVLRLWENQRERTLPSCPVESPDCVINVVISPVFGPFSPVFDQNFFPKESLDRRRFLTETCRKSRKLRMLRKVEKRRVRPVLLGFEGGIFRSFPSVLSLFVKKVRNIPPETPIFQA